MLDLTGKYFIVTGGTQGLGATIARRLAEHGAAGLTISGRQQGRGALLADELTHAGCETLYVCADLTVADDCAGVCTQHHERFGCVDGLEAADASQPFGRILRPDDVAKLTTYLLSDDAALMTGSCIDYDQIVIGARD